VKIDYDFKREFIRNMEKRTDVVVDVRIGHSKILSFMGIIALQLF